MTFLPQITERAYREDQAAQFRRVSTARVDGDDFLRATNERMAAPLIPTPTPAPVQGPPTPFHTERAAAFALPDPPTQVPTPSPVSAAPPPPSGPAVPQSVLDAAGTSVGPRADRGTISTPTRPESPRRAIRMPWDAPESAAVSTFAERTSTAPALGKGPQAFVSALAPTARKVAAETGLPWEVLVSIPANETGWGQAVAGGNLFGIKGTSKAGKTTGSVGTWEVVNGQRVNIQDTFRAYDSPEESMRDFAAFLEENPRYHQALQTYRQTGDAAALVRGIHAAGYATDPRWSDKVLSIMGTVRGTAVDDPLATTSTSARASFAGSAGDQADWQALALDQLSKPYIWGSGSGAGGRGTQDIDPKTGLPRGFDCSGFVSYVLKEGMGIDLPAFTGTAYGKLAGVSRDQAQPGDIVFWNMDNPDPRMQHMAIYLGDGKVIQAGGTERKVNIASVDALGTPEFRRPAGADAAKARQTVGALAQAGAPAAGSLAAYAAGAEGMMGGAREGPAELTDAQRKTLAALRETETPTLGPLEQIGGTLAQAPAAVGETIGAGLSQLGTQARAGVDALGQAKDTIGTARDAVLTEAFPSPAEQLRRSPDEALAQALPHEVEHATEMARLKNRVKGRADEPTPEEIARELNQGQVFENFALGGMANATGRGFGEVTEGAASLAGKAAKVADAAGVIPPKPTKVEQALDSGLILPGRAADTGGPAQILGPRGDVLSTVARDETRQGLVSGVVRSEAGAAAINAPSAETLRRMPNVAKLAPDMPDIAASIQRQAEDNPRLFDAFQQGTITHRELVEDLAPRLGVTADQFLKTPIGKAFTPEELLALRASVVSKQAEAASLAETIAQKGGVDALSAEEKARAIETIVDAARLTVVGKGGGSTAARALNQQKIVISREMAQAITGGNEAKAAQRAAKLAEAKLSVLNRAAAGTPRAAAGDDLADLYLKELRAEDKAAAAAWEKQFRAFEREVEQRAVLAGKGQREGGVAWLEAQRKAAQQEARIAEQRAEAAWNASLRVGERQQAQAVKVLEALGGRDVTDQMLKDFLALQRTDDPLAVAKFLRGLAKVTAWDRISILRYASMLSSTATHLVNATGNLMQAGLDVGLKPLAVGLDVARTAATGGQRTRYMGELGPQVQGMFEGTLAGLRDAATVMVHGIEPHNAGKIEQIRPGFGMGSTRLGRAIGEKPSAAVDFVAEAPLRALAAADQIFRGAARGGQTRALAARQAIREGYSGAAMRARTQEIMENLTEFPALMVEAEQAAARVVLQEARAGSSAIANARRLHPGLNVTIQLATPFVKTPYNIAAQGAGMTPAGLFGVLESAAKAQRAADPAAVLAHHGEMVDRAARAMFGTAVMSGALVAGSNGFLTGAYPEDETIRSTLPPGWQPWSIRIPNGENGHTYVSFGNLGPAGVPFAAAAVMTESARQGKPIDPTLVVGSFGRYMLDQTFMRGLSDIHKVFTEPGRYGENFVEGFASQWMPYAAMQRQVQRALGMASRDPEGALEALLAINPLTAEQVPARQDRLGNPVTPGQTGLGAVVSPFRYDAGEDTPVLKELRANYVSIPPEQKRITRNSITLELTSREAKQLQREAGDWIEKWVTEDMRTPGYQKLNAEGREKRLSGIVEQARAKVATQFFNSLPLDEFKKRQSDYETKKARPAA